MSKNYKRNVYNTKNKMKDIDDRQKGISARKLA